MMCFYAIVTCVLEHWSYLCMGGCLGGNKELHLSIFSSGNSQSNICLQVEMLLTTDVNLT